MMYPYMTLNDNTEITHSEMMEDGRAKVYIETPDEANPSKSYSKVTLSPEHSIEKES